MPGKRRPRLFEYGGQWIGQEPGRAGYYRYWRIGNRVKRRSLAHRELEAAKRELVSLVEQQPQNERDPREVMFATVASSYRRRVLSSKRKIIVDSATGARRSVPSGTESDFNLTVKRLADFMTMATGESKPRSPNKQAFRVFEFDLPCQRAFWRYLSTVHKLGTQSISIYCSYLAAAISDAAKPRVEIVDGDEREILILSRSITVLTDTKIISEVIGKPVSDKRNRNRSLLTFGEIASVVDSIPSNNEHAFRYFVIALNTWARPEAIHQLNFSSQIDFEYGIVDLNPVGREQTKKRRPVIRLTDNLCFWAREWNEDYPMLYRDRPVKSAKKPINNAFAAAGYPDLSRYEIRSFMASHARRIILPDGRRVGKDQRSAWLGHSDHAGSNTTDYYDRFDPEFLQDAMVATDLIIKEIDRNTNNWSLLSSLQVEHERNQSAATDQNGNELRLILGGKR
ncbi:hypothetical protein IWQ51_006831 [Labrenzia sp. EL_142]|nr:hypothetical protein [Labrenzia sp. EL_142]